ncbi:hypothetical protein CPB86DRAFT_792381, partial [Serendipita vermifera]
GIIASSTKIPKTKPKPLPAPAAPPHQAKTVRWKELTDSVDSEAEDDIPDIHDASYAPVGDMELDISEDSMDPILDQYEKSKRAGVVSRAISSAPKAATRLPTAKTKAILAKEQEQSGFELRALVNSSDGRARTIKFSYYDLYDKVIAEVRHKINDINTPLNLSYYTSWAQKSLKRGLDSEEEWQELLALAFANRRKVKDGDHHVRFVHFLDEQPNDKGTKKGGSTQNKDTPQEESFLARIMEAHGCDQHNFQCYAIQHGDGFPDRVGQHVPIPARTQLLWAEDCRDGNAGVKELPRKYVRQILGLSADVEEDAFGHMTARRALPKPRGMNGNIPTTSVQSSTMMHTPQPFSQQFQPTYAGFNGMFPQPSPQIMVVPSHALTSPMRKAIGLPMHPNGPPSPSRLASGKPPKLRIWLQQLDQDLNDMNSDDSESEADGRETYSSYYPQMKAKNIRRIEQITMLTPREVESELGCPFIMAKELHKKAEALLQQYK